METLKQIMTKLHHLFMDLKLSHKLLFGYIIVILLPTTVLEYSLYDQNYNSVLEQYIQNEKSALDMALKNLNIQLNKIQESADFLNSNSILNSYLNGLYDSQSEELYYYIKDIRPLLNYLLKSDTAIQNITFHGTRTYYLNWGNHLITASSSPLPSDLDASIKDLINGVWYKEPGNPETLTYYQCLYNDNYSEAVTTLQIDVSLAALMENFESLSGTLYASFSNDTQPLRYKGHALEKSLNYNGSTLLTLLLLLFLMLSAAYYGITTSITRRISRLQKHISQSSPDSLVPLNDPGYGDEIGQLTSSYNHMVNRINDLLYQIYHTELEKKDAEFYALQAQIEPHFLYNILENIRMSAEQANDSQTAAMVISLGRFMRYNLNSSTGFVYLSDELLHAKNYLDIHKIRMQEKLNVQISVYTEIDDIMCPRFILQPLLENAIKHARTSSSPLTIELSVKDRYEGVSDGDIILEIRDNGEGISPAELKVLQDSLKNTDYVRDAHIGLNSINNRLQAFLGSGYSLLVDSTLNIGTSITLYLKRTGGKKFEDNDR